MKSPVASNGTPRYRKLRITAISSQETDDEGNTIVTVPLFDDMDVDTLLSHLLDDELMISQSDDEEDDKDEAQGLEEVAIDRVDKQDDVVIDRLEEQDEVAVKEQDEVAVKEKGREDKMEPLTDLQKDSGKRYSRSLRRLQQTTVPKRMFGFKLQGAKAATLSGDVDSTEEAFLSEKEVVTEEETISNKEQDHDFLLTSFDLFENDTSQVAEKLQVTRMPFLAEEIWSACKIGDECFVQATLSSDPSLINHEQDGRTPLYYACLCGHARVVELLMEAGAQDSDRKAYSCALNAACRNLLCTYNFGQRQQVQLETQQDNVSASPVEAPEDLGLSYSESSDQDVEEPSVMPELPAPIADTAVSALGMPAVVSLGNDVQEVIDCTSISDDFSSEAEDVDSFSGSNGEQTVDDNAKITTRNDDGTKNAILKYYQVFVPFKSHLNCKGDEGFEAILEPVKKDYDDYDDYNDVDISVSDVAFDPGALADIFGIISVNSGMSASEAKHLMDTNPVMTSKLGLNRTYSLAKEGYDTEGSTTTDDTASTGSTTSRRDSWSCNSNMTKSSLLDEDDEPEGAERMTFEDLKDEFVFTLFGRRASDEVQIIDPIVVDAQMDRER
jgi:hypothetical protein